MEHIPFTQYLLPDGRQKSVGFPIPEGMSGKVETLLGAGAYFECEVLLTGEVSLTCEIEDGEDVEVLSHEVCDNGPEVTKAIERLVGTAHLSIPVGKGE